MIETTSTDTLTHYPMPMAGFGLNPYAQPMWRIVYADSVKRLVGGRWADGAEEYRLAKAYTGPHCKGKWVLESWISAQEHTGCTAQEYVIKFQATNCVSTIQHEPYPYEGTYVERHVFAGPVDGVESLIQKWHHQRNNLTVSMRRTLRQEQIDFDAKKTKEAELYRLREAQPDPNGSMMIKKRRQINLNAASKFTLPGSGFRQVQGA